MPVSVVSLSLFVLLYNVIHLVIIFKQEDFINKQYIGINNNIMLLIHYICSYIKDTRSFIFSTTTLKNIWHSTVNIRSDCRLSVHNMYQRCPFTVSIHFRTTDISILLVYTVLFGPYSLILYVCIIAWHVQYMHWYLHDSYDILTYLLVSFSYILINYYHHPPYLYLHLSPLHSHHRDHHCHCHCHFRLPSEPF